MAAPTVTGQQQVDRGGSAEATSPFTGIVSANDEKLFLTAQCEDNADQTGLTMTYNGNACTLINSQSSGTSTFADTHAFYIDIGSSGGGTFDVVVTWNSTCSNPLLGVVRISGAVIGAPEATTKANALSSPLNVGITTLTDDALVLDGCCMGNPNAIAVTQGPDQVEVQNTTGASWAFANSKRVVATAGSVSPAMGWSSGTWNRGAAVLAAFAPAVVAFPHQHYQMMRGQ